MPVERGTQKDRGFDLPLDNDVDLALPCQLYYLLGCWLGSWFVDDSQTLEVDADLGGKGLDGWPVAHQRGLNHASLLSLMHSLKHLGIVSSGDGNRYRTG